jgi:hypothetical protein
MDKKKFSAERKSLAEAIEAEAAARSHLADAGLAAERAFKNGLEAASRAEAFAREAEEASRDQDHVIRSVVAGGGVSELTRPVDELLAKAREAEEEAEKWRAARKTAEEAIVSRRTAVDWAQQRTKAAASAVIDAETDVDKLLLEVEAAQQIVLSKRAELMALARALPHDSDTRKRIDSFLSDPWLIEEIHGGWEKRAEAAKVFQWLDALRKDAGA